MAELQHEESPPMTIEGLRDSGRDYPLNDVLIRNEGRSIYEVLRRINAGQYIMNPDFQRDFIWDERKQSELIESVIMRIPLPVFYLAEDREGKMIVVDGLQRLSTFKRFVLDGESSLQLENKPDLNGKRFADLPAQLQNRIEDCNLIVYIIDPKTPERMKLDIFERVNSGVPLTRQQMRNAIYSGKGTRFLRAEANTDLFKAVMSETATTDRGRELVNQWVNHMVDRELVNRFCAFDLLGVEEYHGDMDEFLAEAIVHMNGMDDNDLDDLRTRFRTGLSNNRQVFRRSAFRRITRDSRVSGLSAPLWDVMVTGLSRRDANLVNSRREALYSGFIKLLEDRTFFRAITVTREINTTKRVTDRFRIANAMFEGVFNAHA